MHAKRKILIVDDDTFLLDMYAMKFGKNGFEAKTAPGGADALDLLRQGYAPDIMLLDLIMPGLDGFAIVEAARKERLASDALIVMLTNQGMAADMDRAKTLGLAGYIVKATTIPSEVVAEVASICEKNGR